MNKLEFARRLIEARNEKNLNQSDIARGLEISPQAVQKWESGESSPRNSQYDKLENILGRSRQWLMFGIEDQPEIKFLLNEIHDLRGRIDQSLSCLRASETAKSNDRESLIAAAKRILEETKE